jgi:DNA-binding response OmpR family regulator
MTAPATLILAEHETETLQMLEAFFQSQGFRTVHIFDCASVEEMAIFHAADVILLDANLPGGDAFDVARRLNSNRRTAGVSVLMLSDPLERDDRLKALAAGIEDTISRPFDLQELGLRVRNALERTNRTRTLHPITELAEGRPVEEALQRMLVQPEWSLADIRISNFDSFRAARGFPVANDFLRAVGTTLQRAAAERLKVGVLVGHRTFDEFLVLSDLPAMDEFMKTISGLLLETTKLFRPVYSSLDPQNAASDVVFLYRVLTSGDGRFATRESLLAALDQTPFRTP